MVPGMWLREARKCENVKKIYNRRHPFGRSAFHEILSRISSLARKPVAWLSGQWMLNKREPNQIMLCIKRGWRPLQRSVRNARLSLFFAGSAHIGAVTSKMMNSETTLVACRDKWTWIIFSNGKPLISIAGEYRRFYDNSRHQALYILQAMTRDNVTIVGFATSGQPGSAVMSENISHFGHC